MRNDRELIKISLENFDTLYNGSGLCLYFCGILRRCDLISEKESDKLNKLIRKYVKRKRWCLFDKRRVIQKGKTLMGFWWSMSDKESRRNYLEYLLEKVE